MWEPVVEISNCTPCTYNSSYALLWQLLAGQAVVQNRLVLPASSLYSHMTGFWTMRCKWQRPRSASRSLKLKTELVFALWPFSLLPPSSILCVEVRQQSHPWEWWCPKLRILRAKPQVVGCSWTWIWKREGFAYWSHCHYDNFQPQLFLTVSNSH